MPRSRAAVLAAALLLGCVAASLHPGPAAGAQEPTPVAVDTGAADIGSESESDADEAPEPVLPEQEERDEAIRTRLQAIYDRIGSLRDVGVEVEAGIVRLSGRALSVEARQQAVELARETEGVVFVEDRVRVVTDLGSRLEPAVDRIREYAVGAVAFLPLLVVALVILFVSALLGRWAASRDGPHLRLARTPFVRGLLRQAIRVGFTLAGLLVALELLDATTLVGAVLGTAGVFGLALGFAFKDIVENHLAGIMLSLRQPFSPNDHILVAGHEGKVVRLTTRETILMTLDGNHVRIPNAELFRSALTNFTRNPRRRFAFDVSVGTEDDLVSAQEAGLSTLREMAGIMGEPAPAARVHALGDSWVTLRFFGWVDQERSDFGRARSEAIRLVKAALEDAEVTMPSPEYAVVVREGSPTKTPDKEARPERTPSRPPPPQQDVSVDTTLDEQIEEDRRGSDEADLLEPDSEA